MTMSLTLKKNLLMTSCAIFCFALANTASALVLLPGNAASTLSGSLGDVDVVSRTSNMWVGKYLGENGLTPNNTPVEITNVNYSILNRHGNGDIFSFTVTYEPGTSVYGAGIASSYIDSQGAYHDWDGSHYVNRFDHGFGVYDYEFDYGAHWIIEYSEDKIKWIHFGNGFQDGTAIGYTDLGWALTTFSIAFAPDTTIGMKRANVAGNNLISVGEVLSAIQSPPASPAPAVPVPAAAWFFSSGLIGLMGICQHRKALQP